MVIKKHAETVTLEIIPAGECFQIDASIDKFYIKTRAIDFDAGMVECVNLKTGFVERFNLKIEVVPIKAEIIIK